MPVGFVVRPVGVLLARIVDVYSVLDLLYIDAPD
jgi:hypothetical protein